ncbi:MULTISPECIES: hypothetical protein [Enterobacterales]|uniref:hypothetical protein n=1 Tax=Enterobacterales TaxID=91347 RepID=UPI0008480524|nr:MULTISPECIES: hypothetical protein [Enterobacterales]WOO49605.1 hypothetical protein R2S03_19435 [Hafnia alvei]MCK9780406.1 hypothetical protein [Proteus columbae]MCT6518673.1 hypothetical protein [Proteus vulgaris]ODQ03939.1 hypothetical protein BGK50_07890 [Shigella sp. FC130]OEI91622.1 hypothetical protein BHE86_09380 [Shigella sp. FC1655]
MNDENHFFEKIKASLDRASSIIDIKKQIENKISIVIEKLEMITNNKIKILFKDNHHYCPKFINSERLIYINKVNINDESGFILFGYSFSKINGFPIEIETEIESFHAEDIDDLLHIIVNIIDKQSIRIMELVHHPLKDN